MKNAEHLVDALQMIRLYFTNLRLEFPLRIGTSQIHT